MGKGREKPQTEEEIDLMYNDILNFLGGKGIFKGYEIRIGKFNASKCLEKLENAVLQFQDNPSQENLARLEQIMNKAGFDKNLMEEFEARYSIVVKDGQSQAITEGESKTEFDMPDINDILNQEEKDKTTGSEEPSVPKDNKATAPKESEEEEAPATGSDNSKPDSKEVENIENPQMPLNERLEAFLKFNNVDLSKFGDKKEQDKIVAELAEAIEACQKEINPATLKMLGQIVIGKLGMSKDAIARLGDVFVPNWKHKPEPEHPEQDLAVIKEEAKKINNEIEELKKQIEERKQRLEELGEKSDTDEKDSPDRPDDSAEETIGQKADRAMKKHESLATEKSFLSGIASIQSKTLDFYTDHMITGSYDGLKFILAESVALTAMTGYAIGKATLKLGKLAGKTIYKAAKGTAEKAKEKSEERNAQKAKERAEKETKTKEKAKEKEEEQKPDPKPKKKSMTRKERKDNEANEEVLEVIELGKSTSMELLRVSRERLEQVRVDETLLNNPSKEADLAVIRSGTSEDREAERSMLSRENSDLITKAAKTINNLRYTTLCNRLEQTYGISREDVLKLIKTTKVTPKGKITLIKGAPISLEDIENAGAGRLFRDAVTIKGVGTLDSEEVLKLASGINIKDGKVSVDGIESLSSDARLIAASISGEECCFDGVEKLQQVFDYCANTHDINSQIIRESYALDLHQICLDLDCQVEMIRTEALELQAKGIKKTKSEVRRREELGLIADDKVAKLEDLGIIEVIEAEKMMTAKLTKEASRILTPDLTRDIKESVDLGKEFIGPDKDDEK